jgi:hypothetical protein
MRSLQKPKKSLRLAESERSDPLAVYITPPLPFTYNPYRSSCQSIICGEEFPFCFPRGVPLPAPFRRQKMTRRGPLEAPSSTRRVANRHPSPKAPVQRKPTTPGRAVKLSGGELSSRHVSPRIDPKKRAHSSSDVACTQQIWPDTWQFGNIVRKHASGVWRDSPIKPDV